MLLETKALSQVFAELSKAFMKEHTRSVGSITYHNKGEVDQVLQYLDEMYKESYVAFLVSSVQSYAISSVSRLLTFLWSGFSNTANSVTSEAYLQH